MQAAASRPPRLLLLTRFVSREDAKTRKKAEKPQAKSLRAFAASREKIPFLRSTALPPPPRVNTRNRLRGNGYRSSTPCAFPPGASSIDMQGSSNKRRWCVARQRPEGGKPLLARPVRLPPEDIPARSQQARQGPLRPLPVAVGPLPHTPGAGKPPGEADHSQAPRRLRSRN